MPVPRRFDRRPPERDPTRINERIRVPRVRLIGADGEQVGILPTEEALKMAQEAELDLVEVAAEAKPPVTRLLDYSKYKYEQEQKQKQARKHQQQVNVREIKLRPKIADHDYNTKKGHVERFLRGGDKVKITIMFRGREQAHPERGRALLGRLVEDLGELATVESQPLQEGRNMSMMVGPTREATRKDEPAATTDDAAKNGAPAKAAAGEEASSKAAPSEPAANDDAAPAEAAAPSEDATAEEPASDDATAEEPASEDALSEDATAEEPASEDAAGADAA